MDTIYNLEKKFNNKLLYCDKEYIDYVNNLSILSQEDKASQLFALGNVDLLNRPSAGICGSRRASARGLAIAEIAVRLLCENGVVITSGYAAGVDMMAHLAALRANTGTIIVLPEGIAHFSIRKELRPFWDWSKVLIVSQFPLKTPWRSWNAMRRNRTIMALSKVMLVVEAGLSGGTIDAGKTSLNYKVPVFAVDFAESDDISAGNKELISLGAYPLRKNRETGEPSIASMMEIINT